MAIQLETFRKTPIYQGSATVASILSELNELAEIGEAAKFKADKYKKQGQYYILGIVLSIISMILVLITIPSNSGFALGDFRFILLLLASIFFIVACIRAFDKANEYQQLNVTNKLRTRLIKDILKMLGRDMDSSTNVDVYLSFKPIPIKDNLVGTVPHPAKEGWEIDNFQHQWLKIKGQFLDKTRFGLFATGLSKTQYGRKLGRRGKIKYKSKTKAAGLDVTLSLTYPQRRYGAIKILKDEVNGAIQLPNFCRLRGLRVTDKAINLTVRIEPNMADNQQDVYKTITMMFLSMYQVLNLAKVLSK
ncbi:MAG: hypothetical protein ACHBN1_37380 [Heteroscytonema crispum UTEX LB 1556]